MLSLPHVSEPAALTGHMTGPTTGPAGPPVGLGAFTVAELTTTIGDVISGDFFDEVWVIGEIVGNPKPQRSGHSFFDLRDHGTASTKSAPKLPAKLWANHRLRIEAELERAGAPALSEGLQVLVRGKVSYYAPFAEVGFIVSAVDPNYTLGKLEGERRRIIAALTAEGLLRANAARPLPLVPLDVLLVTSHGSAAYNDFVFELRRTPYAFRVQTIDARVQGRDAERTLIEALDYSDELVEAGWPHVVAIVRGGGSSSDLLVFDSERVARRVASHRLPIICGIGHEIDRTVLDEVAHTALITPTATAQFLIERVATFHARLDDHAHALDALAAQAVEGSSARLLAVANKLSRSVSDELARERSHVVRVTLRLPHAANRALGSAAQQAAGAVLRVRAASDAVAAERRRALDSQAKLGDRTRSVLRQQQQRLGTDAKLISAHSPDRVLARGFSITRDAQGKPVRQPPPSGTRLVTTLAEGSVASTVDEGAPGAANLSPPPNP